MKQNTDGLSQPSVFLPFLPIFVTDYPKTRPIVPLFARFEGNVV